MTIAIVAANMLVFIPICLALAVLVSCEAQRSGTIKVNFPSGPTSAAYSNNYRFHRSLEKLTAVVSRIRDTNEKRFRSSHATGRGNAAFPGSKLHPPATARKVKAKPTYYPTSSLSHPLPSGPVRVEYNLKKNGLIQAKLYRRSNNSGAKARASNLEPAIIGPPPARRKVLISPDQLRLRPEMMMKNTNLQLQARQTHSASPSTSQTRSPSTHQRRNFSSSGWAPMGSAPVEPSSSPAPRLAANQATRSPPPRPLNWELPTRRSLSTGRTATRGSTLVLLTGDLNEFAQPTEIVTASPYTEAGVVYSARTANLRALKDNSRLVYTTTSTPDHGSSDLFGNYTEYRSEYDEPTTPAAVKAQLERENGTEDYDIRLQSDNLQELEDSEVTDDNNNVQPFALAADSEAATPVFIRSIDVLCISNEEMKVRITFERPFAGIVYAKGFYSDVSCHFVKPRDARTQHEFALKANSCGTTLVDGVADSGETSLENTLIIQHDERFQDDTDTSRHVQCTWDTNATSKSVLSTVEVDALPSQSVSFSGESVESVMEIQLGVGPDAPPADGLVQIGDPLTAVIYLRGEDAPKFDLRVKDCFAHDGDASRGLPLSDSQGCIIQKRMMSPWTKRRDPGTPTPVAVYSMLKAFRFPEKTEVFFECNVELCKGVCIESCRNATAPESDQDFVVRGRFKRELLSANAPNKEGHLERGVRVVSREDFADGLSTRPKHNLPDESSALMCLNRSSLLLGGAVVMLSAMALCLLSGCRGRRRRKDKERKSGSPVDERVVASGSYHAHH